MLSYFPVSRLPRGGAPASPYHVTLLPPFSGYLGNQFKVGGDPAAFHAALTTWRENVDEVLESTAQLARVELDFFGGQLGQLYKHDAHRNYPDQLETAALALLGAHDSMVDYHEAFDQTERDMALLVGEAQSDYVTVQQAALLTNKLADAVVVALATSTLTPSLASIYNAAADTHRQALTGFQELLTEAETLQQGLRRVARLAGLDITTRRHQGDGLPSTPPPFEAEDAEPERLEVDTDRLDEKGKEIKDIGATLTDAFATVIDIEEQSHTVDDLSGHLVSTAMALVQQAWKTPTATLGMKVSELGRAGEFMARQITNADDTTANAFSGMGVWDSYRLGTETTLDIFAQCGNDPFTSETAKQAGRVFTPLGIVVDAMEVYSRIQDGEDPDIAIATGAAEIATSAALASVVTKVGLAAVGAPPLAIGAVLTVVAGVVIGEVISPSAVAQVKKNVEKKRYGQYHDPESLGYVPQREPVENK